MITGISGSGKSTLMHEELLPRIRETLGSGRRGDLVEAFCLHELPNYVSGLTIAQREKFVAAKCGNQHAASVRSPDVNWIEAVYEVDQSPIGKTSRSTPGTYVKVFDEIRNLYAQLPVSRMRGYSASRFSFNAEGGRCETCKGQGVIKLEMNFLPSSYVSCEDCHGRRYNAQTLEILYNEKSIGDVMEMTIEEGCAILFSASENRPPTFASGRYRSWISEARTTESHSKRRRSATPQAGDAIETRSEPRGERADSKNAQARIDIVFARGTDHRPAHGRH